MAVFRALLLLMLLAGAACFAAYAISGQARFRGYGLRLVRLRGEAMQDASKTNPSSMTSLMRARSCSE